MRSIKLSTIKGNKQFNALTNAAPFNKSPCILRICLISNGGIVRYNITQQNSWTDWLSTIRLWLCLWIPLLVGWNGGRDFNKWSYVLLPLALLTILDCNYISRQLESIPNTPSYSSYLSACNSPRLRFYSLFWFWISPLNRSDGQPCSVTVVVFVYV